jgi:hypothetical protein
MFCPRCSQPQPDADLRFCPRCGFPVGEVKELVGREEARAADGVSAREEETLPAQRDLATGALVMFAGAVVAILWGMLSSRWPGEGALPQTYFILGGTLAFVLTLFHPMLERLLPGDGEPSTRARRRRDGVNLGALLMFLGTLKALLLTSLMPPGTEKGFMTLAFTAGMLLLVLLLRPTLRAVRGLFFKRDARPDSDPTNTTAELDPARAAGLPPAHSIPVNGFASSRPDSADLVAPPSVTESTTRNLRGL